MQTGLASADQHIVFFTCLATTLRVESSSCSDTATQTTKAAKKPAEARRIQCFGRVMLWVLCDVHPTAGTVDETRWDEKAGLRTGCGVRSQLIDVLKAQIKRRPATSI